MISAVGLAVILLSADAAGCTNSDFTRGNCLTALVPEGTAVSPKVAVAQAIERGGVAQARQFVSNRSRSRRDGEQAVLEKLFSDQQLRGDAITAAAGEGTVSGYIHTPDYTMNYFYCPSTGCTLLGKVRAKYVTNIGFYPEVTLDGELSVTQGPTVDFTQNDCLARWDANNWPDSTVHTWSNCPAAHQRNTFTKRALILPETWKQGGTRGEKYYNKYALTFRTSALSKPSFGPWKWDTKRWYIPKSSTHPYWLV
ncbi:hypothetical protein GCM10009630_63770 [Kribbella jejuensis]